MISLAAFRTRWPEFALVGSAILQAAIDDTVNQLSPDVWGARYDEAQYWLGAHLAASAPWGFAAHVKGEDGNMSTTYGRRFDAMVREVGAGYGVT